MPMTDLPISSAVCHAQRSTDWFQPCRSRYAVHSEKNAYQCRVVAEQSPHVGGVGVRRVEEAGELSGGALHDPFEQPDFRLLKQIDQGRVPAVGRLADAGHLVQRVRVERALEQYGVHPLEQIAESRLERIAEKVRRAAYP